MRRLLLLPMLLLLPGLARAQALDEADARLREQAYLHAWSAPLGQAVKWHNPETGSKGSITPERERKDAATGELCRDMLEIVTIGDTMHRGTAAGCRGEDRRWHVVSATPAEVPADLPAYQPPADISADPPHPPGPGMEIRVRPRGPAGAAPVIRLTVPPPPVGQE